MQMDAILIDLNTQIISKNAPLVFAHRFFKIRCASEARKILTSNGVGVIFKGVECTIFFAFYSSLKHNQIYWRWLHCLLGSYHAWQVYAPPIKNLSQSLPPGLSGPQFWRLCVFLIWQSYFMLKCKFSNDILQGWIYLHKNWNLSLDLKNSSPTQIIKRVPLISSMILYSYITKAVNFLKWKNHYCHSNFSKNA